MIQPQLEDKTLEQLFGLSDEKVKDITFPVNVNPGSMVPSFEQAYNFQQDHVRKLLLWVGGVSGRNLLITGPTGCGKSSLIEQLCARLGRELYRVPCHGKLEFADLVGQLSILPDGSTKFVHGPLPLAMQNGAFLLLDEINFIHPSMIGALNTVLDGGPLLISETGQLIMPHPDFRIVGTGNALDCGNDSPLYRGVQRMNLAFMQRFLTLKVDYLDPKEEARMLNLAIPDLPGKVISILAEVADDVRSAFKRGDIESTVSTRTLVKWAKILHARKSLLMMHPEDELKFSLQFVLTDGLKSDDAMAIEGTLQRRSSGLSLLSGGESLVMQNVVGSEVGDVPKTTMNFLVNPNREGNGTIAFWVGIDVFPGERHGLSLNGTISPKTVIRTTLDKEQKWISKTLMAKKHDKGYCYGHTISVTSWAHGEAVVRDVVNALKEAVVDNKMLIRCSLDESRQIAEHIAKQLSDVSYTFQVM
jgi:cobaltochelatase CobS